MQGAFIIRFGEENSSGSQQNTEFILSLSVAKLDLGVQRSDLSGKPPAWPIIRIFPFICSGVRFKGARVSKNSGTTNRTLQCSKRFCVQISLDDMSILYHIIIGLMGTKMEQERG